MAPQADAAAAVPRNRIPVTGRPAANGLANRVFQTQFAMAPQADTPAAVPLRRGTLRNLKYLRTRADDQEPALLAFYSESALVYRPICHGTVDRWGDRYAACSSALPRAIASYHRKLISQRQLKHGDDGPDTA